MTKFISRWKLGLVTFGAGLFITVLVIGLFSAVGLGFLAVAENWIIFVSFLIMLWAIIWTAAILWAKWLAGSMERNLSQYIPATGQPTAAQETAASLADVVDNTECLQRQCLKSQGFLTADLKKSNDFLLSLIKHNRDAIYFMDLEGQIWKVNPAFEQLYGYKEEEVSGVMLPFVPDSFYEEHKELIKQVRGGKTVSDYETVRQTKDGKDIHISLTLSPVLDEYDKVTALVAISRNITERKRTEDMLRRSEKLKVVGQLAAGVAHEIRNPLTTVRGFVQFFMKTHYGNKVYYELMLEELDRINLIISELIVLSKPHLNQFLYKDLDIILMDMMRIMEPQFNMNGVQLETLIEQGLPPIKCEENQLKQMFLNVIKNSMEAMPEGGLVKIEAMKVNPQKILIRITDHGSGIPEELLSRLGEPFLTNKENGTGLGILICQQIISNHNGLMMIHSNLGKGTCVDIILPVDMDNVTDEEE